MLTAAAHPVMERQQAAGIIRKRLAEAFSSTSFLVTCPDRSPRTINVVWSRGPDRFRVGPVLADLTPPGHRPGSATPIEVRGINGQPMIVRSDIERVLLLRD